MEIGHPEVALRPMTCELRMLKQPDGSATFRHGRTSVMAAVYGPVEVRMAKERADAATLDVIFKPKVGTPGCTARAVENVVRGACESAILLSAHPRALFTVVVQELHDDGGLLACCINAVGAALLDACAPMRFPIAAVTCALNADGVIEVDPDASRCRAASTVATFVFEGRERNVIGVSATGRMSDKQHQTCLVLCRQASRDVLGCFREVYKKRSVVM